MKSETTPPGKLTHLNPEVIYKWHMRCATVSLIDVEEVTLCVNLSNEQSF